MEHDVVSIWQEGFAKEASDKETKKALKVKSSLILNAISCIWIFKWIVNIRASIYLVKLHSNKILINFSNNESCYN